MGQGLVYLYLSIYIFQKQLYGIGVGIPVSIYLYILETTIWDRGWYTCIYLSIYSRNNYMGQGLVYLYLSIFIFLKQLYGIGVGIPVSIYLYILETTIWDRGWYTCIYLSIYSRNNYMGQGLVYLYLSIFIFLKQLYGIGVGIPVSIYLYILETTIWDRGWYTCIYLSLYS